MKPAITVIGAGISGLAAAERLEVSQFTVTVFDKGRAPEGRCATRRIKNLLFDTGVQHISASTNSQTLHAADTIYTPPTDAPRIKYGFRQSANSIPIAQTIKPKHSMPTSSDGPVPQSVSMLQKGTHANRIPPYGIN
ncbi:hypothetical protein SeLEV6574_g02935 [Synchytrium endobioticum]|uniref:Amine oxidase domain-containing protein n=1 Tax=Synchytrium endobioticum TaxID=286115 RepID=A0A507D6J6_9FUNG|nr:hypothetical protein SeLEV6574_g02935 [Synchytrium endobioticum]